MKTVFTVGILTVVMLAILTSGCSSDTTYTPPAKVEQVAAQAQTPTPAPAETTPPEPKLQAQQQPTPYCHTILQEITF